MFVLRMTPFRAFYEVYVNMCICVYANLMKIGNMRLLKQINRSYFEFEPMRIFSSAEE